MSACPVTRCYIKRSEGMILDDPLFLDRRGPRESPRDRLQTGEGPFKLRTNATPMEMDDFPSGTDRRRARRRAAGGR
jgi:hypothetical protein